MLRVATCIATEHNLGLVLVAAIVCTFGAIVSARLFQRTMHALGYARHAWTFLGAIAAGSTVWTTHFVAMLAYEPGVPVTYDPMLTMASLAVAIVGAGAAFSLGSEKFRLAPLFGGLVFGLSVPAMHYLGMTAFAANGIVQWDPSYVVASVVLSVGFSLLAFNRLGRDETQKTMLIGAGLLVVAIVTLHFTGMGALTITPLVGDGAFMVDHGARDLLALGVTGVGLLVLGTGAVSYFLDDQSRVHSAHRLRHMAESAVDGMAVVQNGVIIEVNDAFESMTGEQRDALVGQAMSRFLDMDTHLPSGELVRAELRRTDGAMVPVELAMRTEQGNLQAEPLSVFALRDITERLAHEQRISYLAQFDSLTGLRNRAVFLEKIAELLSWDAKRSRFAVFAVDLDRFKEINDIHGHAAGDAVLKAAGERLKSTLGPNRIAARFGGDEFAVFAQIDSRNEAVALAEKLGEAFAGEIEFEDSTLRCGASIGVALYPADGEEINELLNNADLAMYRAKQSGGSGSCFYDKSMDNSVRARRLLIEELRTAIRNDGLDVHYQVQIEVPSEEISGYEALVRWDHPQHGMIPPSEFIPLAEQTGLIVKLGEWVLRRACTEAARWDQPYMVSVNLSPAQLMDAGFVECLQDVLWETGLPPKRLELEVTETSFISDHAKAVKVLSEVKALGVSISIDDFGTGYSSLAMLQEFPFDKIKLDKTLIDDVDTNLKAQGIFRAVLSLGDALAVPVLAEGVESSDQLEYLRNQGCKLVQGYYYGRPGKTIGAALRSARKKV